MSDTPVPKPQSLLVVIDDGDDCEVRITYRAGAPMRTITEVAHTVLEELCYQGGQGEGPGGDEGGGGKVSDAKPVVH